MSEDSNFIRAVLSGNMGKKEVEMIRSLLLHDAEQLEYVFSLIFDTDEKIAWHAAWVIEKVSEHDANLISEDKNRQLVGFVLRNKHQGLQRLCLSILFNLAVCLPVSVDFIILCFVQMLSTRQSVSVQVLSMKYLNNICMIEKDFVPELKVTLENADNAMYSAGYNAAKRHILKSLAGADRSGHLPDVSLRHYLFEK